MSGVQVPLAEPIGVGTCPSCGARVVVRPNGRTWPHRVRRQGPWWCHGGVAAQVKRWRTPKPSNRAGVSPDE
jgi:hypothetical protein